MRFLTLFHLTQFLNVLKHLAVFKRSRMCVRLPTFMKPTVFIIACFALVVMLSPRQAPARTCYNWPAIFEANRKVFAASPKDKRILILPYINETNDPNLQWLSDALRLGLFLALESTKNTKVIEKRSAETTFDLNEAIQLGKTANADYVIAGQYHKKTDKLEIFTRFVDVSAKKQVPIEEEVIAWPSPKKLSELFIHLARRASKAFKKVRVDKKVLMGTENRVRNLTAMNFWVLGQIADAKGTEAHILKARGFYEEAIKNDFNYCYAYLGLAQTLAEIGFMAKVEGRDYKNYFQQAERELTKMLLLCPIIGKHWGRRVTQYLEADALQTSAADRLEKGDSAAAAQQLEEALKALPGDVSSLKLMQQLGKGDTSSLPSLTNCQ